MLKPWETKEGVYCPVNGWDCPYYKNEKCNLETVAEDCDDFYFFWAEEIDAEAGVK